MKREAVQESSSDGDSGAGAESPAKSRLTKRLRKFEPEVAPPYIHVPTGNIDDFLDGFWSHHVAFAEEHEDTFKNPGLPLARIKKVMKMDPDVKMIATEVPILFSKACETFIQELTSRAWLVAGAAKRKTLSRSDVATAIARSDMFDFLIDTVPREDPSASVALTKSGTTRVDVDDETEATSSYQSSDEEAQDDPTKLFNNTSAQPEEDLDKRAAEMEESAAGNSEELAMADLSHISGQPLHWDDPSTHFDYEVGPDPTPYINMNPDVGVETQSAVMGSSMLSSHLPRM